MRILLFTGKGGVGKTTLAAATAARLAERGSKTLVVSTDPAHSLGDAFGVPLAADPVEIAGAPPSLSASQLDTRRLVDGNWQALRGHLRTLLSGAGVDEIDAEELTVLPGVEELLALTEVFRLAETGPWEAVVVDCGPTAETLRLLALPEAVAGYLERLFPSHRRAVRGLFTGLGGVGRQTDSWAAVTDAMGRLAEQLDLLRRALVDRRKTGVRLVCTPERVVAAETRRTLSALALQGIRVDGLIVNRMVPELGGRLGGLGHPAVGWLRARRAEQQAVLDELTDATALAVRTAPYLAAEPIGAPALLGLAAELYGDSDPLAEADVTLPPLLSVRGQGRELDARFELRVSLPLPPDADVDLSRVDDDLAVTVDGRRRLIALPAVLRRCWVTGAEVDDEGLLVGFQPDPRRWLHQEDDR